MHRNAAGMISFSCFSDTSVEELKHVLKKDKAKQLLLLKLKLK